MIQSFNTYWNETPWLSFQGFWLPVLLTAIALGLLTFVLLKSTGRGKKTGETDHLTVFYIHRAFIWASCLVATFWVAFSCWSWTRHLFGQNQLEFPHLFCLFLSLGAVIIGYVSLRKHYSRENFNAIVPISRTHNEAERRSIIARKRFGLLKLAALIPLAGLLFLLTMLVAGRNIIVIFLDNSSSMEAGLARGQQALSQTFAELPENTEVVLASFPGVITGKTAGSVDEILKKTKTRGTLVASQEFAGPADAESYLRGITIGAGSPITEAVWDLFLTLKASRDKATYENRKLLIVTDGADGITDYIANKSGQFLCNEPAFEEFFSSSDVHLISINNETGRFFEDARNCGYDVQDGNSLDSYTAAVDDALGNITADWYFIWWMLILLGVFLTSILLISPERF